MEPGLERARHRGPDELLGDLLALHEDESGRLVEVRQGRDQDRHQGGQRNEDEETEPLSPCPDLGSRLERARPSRLVTARVAGPRRHGTTTMSPDWR